MSDFVPADHTASIEAAAEALRFPSFGAAHRDDAEAALAAAWPHLAATIRAQIEAEQDVEWGVQFKQSTPAPCVDEAHGRRLVADYNDVTLTRRTVTPWVEVQP